MFLAAKPRHWFESKWEISLIHSYGDWKSILLEKNLPKHYKQNKRYELSQKVLKVDEDVDQFFDDMQTLYRKLTRRCQRMITLQK